MNALRSMAAALGGDVVKGKKGLFILCPGPGHSAKDRSLSVLPSQTDPDGFVVKSFANNAWQDCRAHVLARIGGQSRQDQAPARTHSKADNGAAAVRVWGEGVDPSGTLVELYLNSRGLE